MQCNFKHLDLLLHGKKREKQSSAPDLHISRSLFIHVHSHASSQDDETLSHGKLMKTNKFSSAHSRLTNKPIQVFSSLDYAVKMRE